MDKRNKKGQFTQGNKGRPKGAKNKNKLAKKEELEKLFNESGGFNSLFDSISQIEEPKDKANALMKVMEFFMSKERSMEISQDIVFGNVEIIEDDGTESDTNEEDE